MIAITVFFTLLAFVGYVIAGYPLLLRRMARSRANPVRKAPVSPSVSVIIAVHNGEKFLRTKLQSVFELTYPRDLLQVIVVSDGSTDATDRIAAEFDQIRLVRIARGGKAAALNAGIREASGEILLLTDVRQELAPDSLQHLVDNFADPDVGVVSGELIIRDGVSHEEGAIGAYWRYESWIRRQLSTIDSIFGATGPFYAMRRSLAVTIPSETLLDDVYLPLAAFFRGYRLVVDGAARAYDFPTGLETEFRRKVRTLAGNYQLLGQYPSLLGPKNRMWLHFVSYKLGRLMLPFALVGLAIVSLMLPAPWGTAAFGAQVIFYSAALVDPLISDRWTLKRLSAPARTFAVMMVAAVAALSVFFVPPRSLWKVTSAVGRGKAA